MEVETEKTLYQRLSNTQGAATIAGIIFTLVAIFSFVVGILFILKSSQVEFLSEFYIVMAVFLFIITGILLIPGLMFLKFGQNNMANASGTIINYRFATVRNTFIILCVIFGIAGIISFATGAFIFLEEVTRYFRQY
jgi:hypothetical protein